jgi:hypothetical protein
MESLVVNEFTLAGKPVGRCHCGGPTDNCSCHTTNVGTSAEQGLKSSKHAHDGSVSADDPDGVSLAGKALAASYDGSPDKAAAAHTRAAKLHEGMATQAREDGDESAARQHDRAGALHRKAASIHTAADMTDDDDEPEDTSEENPAMNASYVTDTSRQGVPLLYRDFNRHTAGGVVHNIDRGYESGEEMIPEPMVPLTANVGADLPADDSDDLSMVCPPLVPLVNADMHSFDQTLSPTSRGQEPTQGESYQYDGYWTPKVKKAVDGAPMPWEAAADEDTLDEMTKENRRRQGLDLRTADADAVDAPLEPPSWSRLWERERRHNPTT